MFCDEAKVAAKRHENKVNENAEKTAAVREGAGIPARVRVLPVVSGMASTKRDVLHLEEVTASVILKVRNSLKRE